MRPSLLGLLGCVVLGALPGTARAQGEPFARGIDTVTFKLSPSLNSGLVLEGGELEQARSFALQAVIDLNFGLLALKLGPDPLGDLLPFRGELHLMAAWQVHPRLELAADLPITFLQVASFDLLTRQGLPQDNPRVARLGAPRLLARVQLLRQSELFKLFALAASLELRVPVGDAFSFLSDRGFVFAPRLAIERDFGPLRLLANVGWRLRTAPGQFLNLFVGQEFTAGVGVIVAVPELQSLRENQALLELNVATAAEAPFTLRDSEALKTPLELMLGVRTVIADHWRVQLSVGKGLGAPGYGREALRVSVGLTYLERPPADRDQDLVADVVDRCPDEAEDRDGFQDDDGCPDPVVDRDGDGVPDDTDQCPEVPGPVELDGCPDKDGDQLADVVDKCPDQPGPADLAGCPPPPEEEPVVLESERIRINNQIRFEFGSDRLDPRSFALLDDVARVLTDNPDVGPVMIEGHTDNVGPRAFNLDLSRRRARAVELYLVGKGLDRTRLRSAGYGFDRPLVPNDSPLNRARNRRTEFKLLEEAAP